MKHKNKTKQKIVVLFFAITILMAIAAAVAWAVDPAIASSDIWDGTVATSFERGTGTKDDPYIIKTPGQLAYLASSVNNGMSYSGEYIKLANNIYLNDAKDWESWGKTAPANVWTPIGTSFRPFEGTFDGDGNIVFGIYINGTKNDQGLFGYIGSGSVQNISVKESYVSGYNNVGGVSGENYYGTVQNCFNEGTVKGNKSVGGVCGLNFGSISNCHNNGYVSGNECVGGVCGFNYGGDVSNCYNAGDFSGKQYVGGVCGYNAHIVSSCYNVGTVSGNEYVGGVCGLNYGSISNCYYLVGCATDGSGTIQYGIGFYTKGSTTADISGQTSGLTDSQMKQKSSFVGFDFVNVWTIDVEPDYPYPNFGHFYGSPTYIWNGDQCTAKRVCAHDASHIETQTVTAKYVKDTDATCTENEKGHFEATFTNAAFVKQSTAVNSVEKENIKLEHSYGTPTYQWKGNKCIAKRVCTRDESHVETEIVTGQYVEDTDATLTENEKGHYVAVFTNAAFTEQSTPENSVEIPSHIWDGSTAEGFESGTGTKDDPFIIKTPEQLAYLASSVNNGMSYSGEYIKLANNIYLNDATDWESWGKTAPANVWTPIGTSFRPFEGTFDGDGNIVFGVYINGTKDYQGLFGSVKGIVKNTGIEESYVSGDEYVGGVCGLNYEGRVTNCYNAGDVSGNECVGGVCGCIDNGDVSICYNEGNVSGNDQIGGVCGDNYGGDISNCYNIGTVSGNSSVGGVCGGNNLSIIFGGAVSNCYNVGTVSGNSSVSGVCGHNSATVSNCYYLIGCTTGKTTADISGQTAGLTDSQMKEKAFFVGFDFVNVWTLDVESDYPYPNFGHFYGTPTYTWKGDQCTATRVCKRDASHKETETVTGKYVKDTDGTCVANEKGHYEATFTNPAFEKQSTASNSVEKPNSTIDNHTPASPVRENEVPATTTTGGSYDEVVYCEHCHTELSRTPKTTPKIEGKLSLSVPAINTAWGCTFSVDVTASQISGEGGEVTIVVDPLGASLVKAVAVSKKATVTVNGNKVTIKVDGKVSANEKLVTLSLKAADELPTGNTAYLTIEDTVNTAAFKPLMVYEMGDVNMDGKINSRDAVLIQQYAVKMVTFTEVQAVLADVSCDGKINSRDAVLIQQFAVKMPVELGDRKKVEFKEGTTTTITRTVRKGKTLTVVPTAPEGKRWSASQTTYSAPVYTNITADKKYYLLAK